jgi:hypothetical protein
MAKHNLLADTVLRRDGAGDLYLMNRKDHGWSSYAYSVKSEEAFLASYNATLGEWDKDEHGDYCPVTRVEPQVISPAVALAVAMVDAHEALTFGEELEAFRSLRAAQEARGPALVGDGLTHDSPGETKP